MVQWPTWLVNKRWGNVLRGVVAIVLVMALAVTIAQTIWLVYLGPQDAAVSDAGLPVVSVEAPRQRQQLSSRDISAWQLFGEFEPLEQAPEQPTEAPDTRLRLTLLGVFQSTDAASASAIIAEQGGSPELYRVGASVPGNATLEEVYADRVILRRAGALETLRWSDTTASGLDISPSSGARERSSTASRRQPASRPDRRTPSQPRAPSSPAPEQDAEAGSITAQTPEELEEELQLDGDLASQREQIVSRFGLQPVSSSSEEGYRLGSQVPQALLQQVGLRPSDVVVSVNGINLGSEQNDVAAMQSFQDTQRASIVVQRGNRQFTVNFPP